MQEGKEVFEAVLQISRVKMRNKRDNCIHGHHQMVNTEIRLIIFFAAEAGEALYSQQKQDLEPTMARIMSCCC